MEVKIKKVYPPKKKNSRMGWGQKKGGYTRIYIKLSGLT